MATSEILGLFTSPQQYQQNQLAQFQNRAFQEVQLNPFQQAALGARTAGYQLGQGVGGALGGQDPQLQLIARRQQFASQLDPNNPDSYMQVAKMAADAGDQQFAIAVSDAGRKVMGDFALIQQRNRERQGADPFEQLVRSGKYTPASLAAYKLSQNVGDLVLFEKEGAANKPLEFEVKEKRLQDLKANLRVLQSQPNPNTEAIQRLKDSIQAIEGVAKPESRPSVGSDREGVSLELYDKPYFDLNQVQRSAVNKRVETESAAKVPKIQVDLKDPTAVAKANLEVMGKWEGFLKSGGDVEVANRYKSVISAVAMANAGNPSADGSLLYNIAKMYDPSGAVQEGDKKSITGNPAIPERFKLLVQGVLDGGSFTPKQRKDLEKIANDIVKNRESQLNVYRKQYVGKVKTLGGTEEDILNPYQGLIKEPLTNFIIQSPNTNPQGITGGRR
jgi:hypothetical protein